MGSDHLTVELDVLIFGGGIAGLWLLDELHRRSYRVLLVESRALGAGQTIASQGILHGGLKYALGGFLSRSARAAGEMTDRWQACLHGRAEPNLRNVRIASPCCHLWRTEKLSSRVALSAARIGLRTPVRKLTPEERPPPLKRCPGEVLRVDEPVLDVASLLTEFARRHVDRIVVSPNVTFDVTSAGCARSVRVNLPGTSQEISLVPVHTIFTAGEGNAELRRLAGLSEPIMQRRPLHMVLVRGELPTLFGHCVDGNKTRVTITSSFDSAGRTVWHVGGEIAEKGVALNAAELIAFARRELSAVLPGVNLCDCEWAAYRIQRAEGKHPRGARPDGPVWRREGTTITAWPTKLVLAPALAESVADALDAERAVRSKEAPSEPAEVFRIGNESALPMQPIPPIAVPPWDAIAEWHRE